jgi:hypothetical protein
VIHEVRPGEQIPGGLASEYRYLLSEAENSTGEEDSGLDL